MAQYILVIDEGTTSTRAIIFDLAGKCVADAALDLTQYYPQPGYVEHDAVEIWDKTLAVARQLVTDVGGPSMIQAIGITNQRETLVAWDKRTGEPLARAIVWQDRRTAPMCATLKHAGHEAMVQHKTGLLLDPYFTASKMAWALENLPQLAEVGANLALGTVESYLIHRLTQGLHVSDVSNASRTMLMALDGDDWDDELLALFNVPKNALPQLVDNAAPYGKTHADIFGVPIAICGSAGDQQAALIGQGCLAKGQTKATFGTGAFILTQNGRDIPRSNNRLLSTVSHQIAGERHYALEGSVFVAGSLMQWLRDDLGLLAHCGESEALARSVGGNQGVYIVPALAGLGAPHWRSAARGAMTGLSFASHKAHIARAALEAMAHQCHDLKAAFAGDGADWSGLRVDGGMVANGWMVQDLANILDIQVSRPQFTESTALGAAMLAAVGAGCFASLADAVAAMRSDGDAFTPEMASADRVDRLSGWKAALQSVLAGEAAPH